MVKTVYDDEGGIICTLEVIRNVYGKDKLIKLQTGDMGIQYLTKNEIDMLIAALEEAKKW